MCCPAMLYLRHSFNAFLEHHIVTTKTKIQADEAPNVHDKKVRLVLLLGAGQRERVNSLVDV